MIALLLALLVVTAAFGLGLCWARRRVGAVPALLLDLLPPAWMFAFALLDQYAVKWLIPVRDHGAFPPNALGAAGLMALASALLPRRARFLGTGIVAFALAFVSLADIVYDRYFGNVLPVLAAGSAVHLWDVRDSILAIFESYDWWMTCLFASAALVVALWREPLAGRAPPRWVRALAWVVPVVVIAAASVPVVHADVSRWLGSKYAREVLNRHDSVEAGGIIVAHIRETALAVKQALEHRPLNAQELDETKRYFEERRAASDPGEALFGVARGKSVLVLQVEALEEWVLDARVGGEEITPFLNRLKRESLYYPHLLDQTGSSSTSDCEYLVLNSQHPLDSGSVAFRRESNHFVTLATELKARGYSTLSMHAYHHGMWNRAFLHPRYGFDRSLFKRELGDEPRLGWGLDDVAFFAKAVPEIERQERPYVAFLITLSSHHPYTYIPRSKRRLELGPLEGTMVGSYVHSVEYADRALAGFFRDLEEGGLLDDTLVVLYGDHDGHLKRSARDGAAIDQVLDVPPDKRAQIATGSVASDRVPLLIRLPGGAHAGVVDAIGGQVDVAPTVLHLAGVEHDAPFIGRALVPGMSGGRAARWDGSALGDGLVLDAGRRACATFPALERQPLERCQALETYARAELDMSWRVTNYDLARQLTTP